MPRKTLEQIERILKSDIKWAITKGPGFDGAHGADVRDGKFVPQVLRVSDETTHIVTNQTCGVCAIGAFCVRRNPNPEKVQNDDVKAAAKFFGRPSVWVDTLYLAVADLSEKGIDVKEYIRSAIEDQGDPASAVEMSARLVKYARVVKKNWDKKQESAHA